MPKKKSDPQNDLPDTIVAYREYDGDYAYLFADTPDHIFGAVKDLEPEET